MRGILAKVRAFFTQPLFQPRRPNLTALPAPPQPMPQTQPTTASQPEPSPVPPQATHEAPATPAAVITQELPPSHKQARLPVIRTELNFEKYPIFTTSKFKGKSREIVEASTARDGSTIERRITIGKTESNIEVGVLTSTHQDLFYILQDLWEQAGHPEKTLISLYQLTNRLKIKKSGRAYGKVKHWLGDLRQIPITWVNSFYDANTQEHTQAIYYQTVLSQLAIAKRQKGERTKAAVAYTLDEHIQRNLLAHHSHPLLIETSLSLNTEYAKLLYPYIDRRLARTNRFEATLTNLWQTLGLSDAYIRKPSDRKSQLAPAFRELTGKPLSTGVLLKPEVEKTADSTDYKAIFTKAPRHGALTAKPRKPRQLHLKGAQRPRLKPLNQPHEISYLTDELVAQLGDTHSKRFYEKVATYCPQDLIWQLLSQVKHDYDPTQVIKSKGAIFTDLLKQRAPYLFTKHEPPTASAAEGSDTSPPSPH